MWMSTPSRNRHSCPDCKVNNTVAGLNPWCWHRNSVQQCEWVHHQETDTAAQIVRYRTQIVRCITQIVGYITQIVRYITQWQVSILAVGTAATQDGTGTESSLAFATGIPCNSVSELSTGWMQLLRLQGTQSSTPNVGTYFCHSGQNWNKTPYGLCCRNSLRQCQWSHHPKMDAAAVAGYIRVCQRAGYEQGSLVIDTCNTAEPLIKKKDHKKRERLCSEWLI